MSDSDQDVPSPIDLRQWQDAKDWVATAELKRPWRSQIRSAIAELLSAERRSPRRILELGSGPGLLAEVILQTCAPHRYILFDFSSPMLELSRERVGKFPAASFVQGDFKLADWPLGLGSFEAVVSMQAVHEIRHKRHVPELYHQILELLEPNGVLIVCDHTPPDTSARLTALHSTESEQHAALTQAGFLNVKTHLSLNGLYICSGSRAGNKAQTGAAVR